MGIDTGVGGETFGVGEAGVGLGEGVGVGVGVGVVAEGVGEGVGEGEGVVDGVVLFGEVGALEGVGDCGVSVAALLLLGLGKSFANRVTSR